MYMRQHSNFIWLVGGIGLGETRFPLKVALGVLRPDGIRPAGRMEGLAKAGFESRRDNTYTCVERWALFEGLELASEVPKPE